MNELVELLQNAGVGASFLIALAAASLPVFAIIVVLRPHDAFFRFFAGGTLGASVVRGVGIGIVAIANQLIWGLLFA